MSEMTPEEKKKMEEVMKDNGEPELKITTLAIAYFPGFNDNPKLVVGLQTAQGIQTINEFRNADAKGLFNTLTNPKIKNIVNLEGRKKK
ncbi:MAG: hypothetical protein PHE09_11050 [Oscillospiraceae bacterium]|nr:hypothetical protein [Oscillospiraceae bacterium]